MTRRATSVLAIATLSAAALALAGCAAPEQPADGPDAGEGIRVVASTDVYADIASAIGGDLVSVEAIISGSAADPHSYEATARDQLAIGDADLIILNGGGYDHFMTTLIEAAGTAAPVISAVDASGLLDEDHDHDESDHDHDDADHDESDHDHDDADHDESDHDHDESDDHGHIHGFNEHVWYSLHAMEHLAEAIEHELAHLDPDNAAVFEANAERFADGIETLEHRAEEIAATAAGAVALVTEPVPLYLLEAAGVGNATPEAFMEAVEEGSEISVALLDEVLQLAAGGGIALLAYNVQTVGPETERVLEAAEGASVPVVSFSETLPAGQDYLSWMSENLEAIAAVFA